MNEKKTVKIRIKMLEGCQDIVPRKAHHDDAAFDIMARKNIDLIPGQSHLVPTGLFIELPTHYEAQIRPRSGLALKHTLTVANTPGTIDSGYRGEICVIMLNAGKETYSISRGDRIAQMVINRLPDVELIQSEELSESKRGANGFGSTGKA